MHANAVWGGYIEKSVTWSEYLDAVQWYHRREAMRVGYNFIHTLLRCFRGPCLGFTYIHCMGYGTYIQSFLRSAN
jgi:hypothetical protein